MTSSSPEMGLEGLHPELSALIQRALSLLNFKPPSPAPIGLLQTLRHAQESEQDPLRKQHLENLLNDFQTWFQVPSRKEPSLNDGQIVLTVAKNGFQALLTLTPPRAEGSVPTLNKVLLALENKGICHGLDLSMIHQALETVRERNDLVLSAPIARGEPPIPGKPLRMEFSYPVLDKGALRTNPSLLSSLFSSLGEPLREGAVAGRLCKPEPGIAGRDVFDKTYPPPELHVRSYEYERDLRLEDDRLVALAPGHLLLDGNRVLLEPLYIVENPAPQSFADFTFDGGVLVRGNLQGPGFIRCEDLYVAGNCEQMNIVAQGDVFITGGIIGHRASMIETDGEVYASFASEAEISALGQIVMTNAIINSKVVSTDQVRVTSNKGMITGGSIQALKAISARTIGSEFGMLTETIVGKDFLSTPRLKSITEHIKLHEDNLRRIADLKNQLVKAHVRVEQLSPDKQEIYIGVLRKESNSQSELRSLARRRDRLSRSLADFLSASIQVLDSIYPPVRVQIVNEITEITRQLNAVTLQYDKVAGIVSNYQENRKEGSP